ncbi:MAG TPA: nuclear transport factor 2 family protein [Acidimicrobiales bacterium]|nr:nuclear transport factor 2 family protein [Acidimicrobiales bacterium]
MTSSEVAITNLLYRYAETIDSGRFEELAEDLFATAEFIVAPPPARRLSGPEMARLIASTTIRHADGTPRTKHVVSNPIVEIDEQEGVARCRSYYTVFQKTDALSLQPIVAGRYDDRFRRIDGEWRFAERDYTMIDMMGDVRQHLRMDPTA